MPQTRHHHESCTQDDAGRYPPHQQLRYCQHAASQFRQEGAAKQSKRQLNKDRKRIADERFDSLMAEYEAEQKELKAAVVAAEQNLAAFTEDSVALTAFWR